MSNPVYIGRISHKGEIHPGQHQGIVDEDVWHAVQARLATNAQTYSERSNAAEPNLLAGMLFDSEGRRLQPTHAKKGGKRYRYYYHRAEPGAADGKVPRIPASELERLVLNEMGRFLRDEQRLLAAVPQRMLRRPRACWTPPRRTRKYLQAPALRNASGCSSVLSRA